MRSNARVAIDPPYEQNSLTRIWKTLDAATCLNHHILEYLKLVEIAVVQVLGYVENKRVILSIEFLKFKVPANLDIHLQVVIAECIHNGCICSRTSAMMLYLINGSPAESAIVWCSGLNFTIARL